MRKAVQSFESKLDQSTVEARESAVRQLLSSEEAYTAKLCQYVYSFIVPLRKEAASLGISNDEVHTLNV